MYRPFKSVSISRLLCYFMLSPVLISGSYKLTQGLPEKSTLIIYTSPAVEGIMTPDLKLKAQADNLYDSIRLKRFGLNRQAFEYAWKGYNFLETKRRLSNPGVLSICDFSLSSRARRFFVIDLNQKKVLVNTYVAHGHNSGGEYASSFSNSPESHKSSLGFYVTSKTYYGDHGLSLKIEGLEKGINDNADARNIVIHGSKYVGRNYLQYNRINGRSYGCPAIPSKDTDKVIGTIKDGSCLFIYHPEKSYRTKSKILNG